MPSLDYLNPFTIYPGSGWSEATGPINEPSGTTSIFVDDDFGNDTAHENGKSAKINIYGTSVDEYLITPKFDLSGGTYYLNADLALTIWNTSTSSSLDPDDYLALLVTQDDGATWTELARWDENSTLTPEGAPMDEITLSGYNNETYFAFYAFSDTSGVDNDLFIDNFQITATSLSDTAGVEDESLVTLNVYPNPASDVLNISAQNTINTVEIFNVLGQKVITMQVENTSAEINVSNLNAGIYLIKYEINNSISTKKFVKN
jgi:hypothetical protein